MVHKFGEKTFITIMLGYIILISYTWPLGFIPVVSVESLPILLLGFSFTIMILFASLSIMFAPFSLLTNKNLLRTIFNEDKHKYDDLWDEDKGNKIKLPALDFIRSIIRESGWYSVVYACLSLIVIMLVSVYSWYVLASSSQKPWALILLAIPLWYGYKALINLFRANSLDEMKLPVVGVTFFFVIVPTFFPALEMGGNLDHSPNVFVQRALQSIGAGGGLLVEINPLKPLKNGAQSDIGKLLFFDGNRVWYIPCNKKTEDIIQVDINSLRFIKAEEKSNCL